MLAQLSGIWYGELVNDSTHKKQSFEIGLSEYKGKITGFTYTTFISNDTFYFSVKRVKAERKDSMLVVVDDEMLYNNFPERAAKGVKQSTTFPLINDSTFDITKGRWSTNQTKRYYSIAGSAAVKEVEDKKESELVSHLDEIKVKNNLAVRNPAKQQETAVVKNSLPQKSSLKNSAINNKKESTSSSPVVVNKPVESSDTEKKIPASEQNKPAVTTASEVVNVNASDNNSNPNNKSDIVSNQKTNINTQQVKSTENIHSGGASNASTQKTNVRIPTQKNSETVANQKYNANTSQQNSTVGNAVKATTVNKQAAVTETKPEIKTTAPVVNKPKADSAISRALPQAVAVRKSETVQSLYFHSDSLVLSLYDNGVVDGDTVSVFMNGNPIFSKQMLKVTASKKTIYITPDMDSVQIVLFADNLGSIPPNTGLLTVRDGDNVYNVRFSADFDKNAAIVLRRKK
jgi:hypothetical protein